jgi:hypothetical protein
MEEIFKTTASSVYVYCPRHEPFSCADLNGQAYLAHA